ncbi:MAG: hypothetical protein SGJ17_09250 [Hyphomicrobiales bacterium]|nr:hypothetical protein [Hyphomicrobiales bacterium]
MKAIFGVLGFMLFGFIGMFMGGLVEPYIVDQFTFTNPDDHGTFTLAVNVGTALAMAIIGAFVGRVVGKSLKPHVIKMDA